MASVELKWRNALELSLINWADKIVNAKRPVSDGPDSQKFGNILQEIWLSPYSRVVALSPSQRGILDPSQGVVALSNVYNEQN